MRQLLSAVMVAGSIGACSLIYNPSNLPTAPIDAEIVPDAMIDAEVVADADPSMLAITSVSPAVVNEGQGDGGSHPAMIVVEGMQFVPGAKVTLTKHSDQSPFTGAIVDDANTIVSDDGYEVAAPVKFKVDTTLPAGMMVRLDVTVTQKTANGMTVTKTLTAGPGDAAVLQENGLGELHDGQAPLLANNVLPDNVYTFSEVLITTSSGGKSIVPKDNTAPIIIRAIASAKITGAISLDAAGQIAGPGGNNGGNGGAASLTAPGPGGPGGGSIGGGKPNGGGGSFGTKGGNGGGQAGGTSGERELLTLSGLQGLDSSSGGAGAGGATLAAGGVGGGGGGTIEISAGGNLELDGTITATGGNATGTSAGNGGGGSGGAILLRAGGTLTVSTVTAAGGLAGTNGGSATAGGVGGAGRIRVDAPVASALGFQGPQFAAAPIVGSTTLVARDPKPIISVQGTGSSGFGYFFSNADGTMISNLMTATIANNGLALFTVGAPLYHGLNHFCVTPAGGTTSALPEALNCIDIVYLFKLP